VHGVGQRYLGPRSMQVTVAAAVADGVGFAVGPVLAPDDVVVAFYGDWFRSSLAKGQALVDEVRTPFEEELLLAMWRGAAAAEPDRVSSPGREDKARVPRTAERALAALSHSRFLAGLADRFLVGVLGEVRAYLTDPDLRAFARGRVLAAIGQDTRVVIGHSLGSVVAYEALCQAARDRLHLITLGSPLGIANLVFDRLDPAPVGGRGVWPPAVSAWTNICDRYDVVALVKLLAPLFGDGVRDEVVDNGWRAHELARHLTAAVTGRAVAAALTA
jgi:hypothetical protein